jgi:DnaJ-class molecular chaperone
MKDYTLIDKSDYQLCYRCDGTGWVNCFKDSNETKTPCTVCDGTGLWKEPHYIIIDEKNSIAFDTDNGG